MPSNLVMLSVTDVSESLSSLLASLPGTLQTMINTSIALAKARAAARLPPRRAGMAAGHGRRHGAGDGAGMRLHDDEGRPTRDDAGRTEAARRDDAGRRRGRRAGSMSPGLEGPGGNGSSGAANDAMIVIKVDPDKLPKAADLKAQLFPRYLLRSAWRTRRSGSSREVRFPICPW